MYILTAQTATPKPSFDPMKAFHKDFKGKELDRKGGSSSAYGLKGEGEAVPVFRNKKGIETKGSKISLKAREIREWVKGKSGSNVHRSATHPNASAREDSRENYTTRTRQTVGGVRDLIKNRRNTSGKAKDRGPKPGQTYEIVEHRIVENNPERTVEISTWREHAEKKREEEDEERMSIYYISADEYAQEEKVAKDPKSEHKENRRGQVDREGSGSVPHRRPTLVDERELVAQKVLRPQL